MQLIKQALNLAPLRQIKGRDSLNVVFEFIKRPNARYLDSDRPLHRTDGDFLRAEFAASRPALPKLNAPRTIYFCVSSMLQGDGDLVPQEKAKR